jgi:hypothetical protein
MFFGALGANKIQNALKRILEKVRLQHFNGVEVTGIVAKTISGRALYRRFGTLAARPTELLPGWRPRAVATPIAERARENASANTVRHPTR